MKPYSKPNLQKCGCCLKKTSKSQSRQAARKEIQKELKTAKSN